MVTRVSALAGPRVLVVCTANVCRSPMAAALLSHRLQESGLHADVSSAGVRGGRLPLDPRAVAALAALGVPLNDHVSRQLNPEMIETDGADLVITMAREHLRFVSTMSRASFRRTFTLPELVRRAASLGAPDELDGFDAWIRRVGEGRRPSELMGSSDGDDVEDPYGRGPAAARRTAAQIDAMIGALVALAPWRRH